VQRRTPANCLITGGQATCRFFTSGIARATLTPRWPKVIPVNSSFIGTNLQQQLDAAGIDTIVIVGLTTEHCVSTTARMAGNFGYHTYVVADATAAFAKTGTKGEYYNAETVHLTALAQLNNEFATVLNTDEVLNALKKTMIFFSNFFRKLAAAYTPVLQVLAVMK
jgi:hypothetical protein